MANYTQTTFFAPKDSLPANNPAKTIFGAAYDVEFGNLSTAIASKANTNAPTFTGGMAASGGFTNSGGIVNTGGITEGTPTGGNEGSGTINVATGYYLNGSLLPPVGVPSVIPPVVTIPPAFVNPPDEAMPPVNVGAFVLALLAIAVAILPNSTS